MSLLVISCSLDPDSRSRVMARHAVESLTERGAASELLDLQEAPLPLCDGSSAYEDPRVQDVSDVIRRAEGILLAAPVYNFDVNAAAKNLLELTGKAWTEKVVGFLLAAGGQSSYMSIMGLANSLMLDYRCLILPKFVYATGQAFDEDELADAMISARIDELTETLIRVSQALRS